MASPAGKVILVTGGTGALGKAFVQRFLSLGCKVCVGDLNAETGAKVIEELSSDFGEENVKFTVCDVTSQDSFKGAFEKCKEMFGRIDVLINNAGIKNEKDFKALMEVNLFGTIRGTELAIEIMGKNKGGEGGRVINIASIAGLKDHPFGPYYSTSKSGIIHFTRVLGHPFHLNYTGVTIQCLCPSLVNTPFIRVSADDSYNPQCEAAVKSLFGKIPLMETVEVVDGLMKLYEDSKPGSVMVVEKGKNPYYVDPSIPA